jgi:hypothetical protein
MRSMDAYPWAAMERAMKVQDVMLQAMAKKIPIQGERLPESILRMSYR